MKRAEAEARILEKLKEIVEIGKAHDPDFDYISLVYINGHMMFSNKYWEKSAQTKINYWQGGEEDE